VADVTAPTTVAAVDLGASGGRVMTGAVGPGLLTMTEAHRFRNAPVTVAGTLHWDVLALYREVLAGVAAAAAGAELSGLGVDSWGVDYGLLDASGALLGNPVHYRDSRTDGVMERVLAQAGAAKMYALTGVQQLPINTIYQLVAAAGTPQLAAATTLLMIPDLLSYWLTGRAGAELTNASTTGLYDPAAGGWAAGLMEQVGIAPGLFPPLRRPGERIGDVLPEVAAAVGQRAPLAVIAVGSHDTASAVAAVPADGAAFAYISCGTWSLVGVELDRPVLTEASRLANFTNEAGIDGTVRYLRNVMGLWLLQESARAWSAAGRPDSLGGLLAGAARAAPLRSVVDPHDPAFLPPGDMPGRIAAACRATGQPEPASQAETVRCVLDSLALAHRRAVRQAQQLSGRAVDTVHVVGGGARNGLLCQLTADACQLPVLAGPAEAAALGNILVQARALGAGPGGLPGMRALVRGTQPLRRYEPTGTAAPWLAAAARAGLAGD
jgi:rhamnulokinase